MTSRRDFLGITAGTMAVLLTGNAASAQGRREITIGGRKVTVVDMHAHCLIPEVNELIAGTRFELGFPEFQLLDAGRLSDMDERGIDVQVLSMNVYWWYEADRDLAGRVVRLHDEKLAEWCNRHPDRFVALSSVALQFPDLAAEQLEYAVKELGSRGASVGGHVQGESLSLSKFDPFWAKAEELGVPVFMHPLNADYLIPDDAWGPRADLGNIIGNPLESTIFLTRMIFDGVLDRFPDLTLCVAHGGGYLPSYMGRTEVACDIRPGADCKNRKPPSEYLKSQVVVDSMVFSQAGLRHLVEEVGPSQIVYGSDLPFNWPDTIDLVADSPHLNDSEKAAILGGNLQKLLRIAR
jgi:aminocarboxymuconate-semialdehyde decarboxylase